MPSNFSGTTASGVVYNFVFNPGILGIGDNYNMTITDPDGTVTTVNDIPAANVLTAASGGTLDIASALAGSNYVVPPGVTGNVDILITLATLTPNTIYVGGNATISTAASALSSLVVDVDGGTATATSGAVGGALSGMTVNLSNDGTFSNGGSLISLLQGTTINFDPNGTGGTFIANAGGALLDLSGTTINNFDAATDTIEFQNLSAALDHYTVTTSGGSQTIELFDNNNNEIGSVTVAGTSFDTGAFSAAGNGPLTVSQDGTTISVIPVPETCFLTGTLIRTPDGEIAVEDIRAGDRVVVHGSDAPRDVVWVGSKHVTARPGLPLDEAGYPVRVLQNAIAEGVPNKDLLITPEHSLFFDGGLVPVRMLVNGRSIFYDTAVRSYDYYHIETSEHSVIYADGMPTESYLDTGNRGSFSRFGGVASVVAQAKTCEEDAAAPLTVSRERVEPLFRQIEARAEAMGVANKDAVELTSDPNLYLVTDTGRVLRKARDADGLVLFMIPPGVSAVSIVSRASRPSDAIGPFVDDRRSLGVCVGAVTLWAADAVRKIDIHLTADRLPGWDVKEGPQGRWTNGHALLPLGERKVSAIGMLGLAILAAGPYVAENVQVEDARLTA